MTGQSCEPSDHRPGAMGDTGARAGPGSRGGGPEAEASQQSPWKRGLPQGGLLQHRRHAGTCSTRLLSRHGFLACFSTVRLCSVAPPPPAPTTEPHPETEQVNRGTEMMGGGMCQRMWSWEGTVVLVPNPGRHPVRPSAPSLRDHPLALNLHHAALTFTPMRGLFLASGPLHMLFALLGLSPPTSPLCDTKSYSSRGLR